MSNKPRYTPPEGYYFDDPADKIDPVDPMEELKKKIPLLASEGFTVCNEWITRGRGKKNGMTNRAFRSDIVVLCLTPDFLPTDRPSAAWVARQHGRSRQRASELAREFAACIAPYIQFRGQRFLNQRQSRGRQGKQEVLN